LGPWQNPHPSAGQSTWLRQDNRHLAAIIIGICIYICVCTGYFHHYVGFKCHSSIFLGITMYIYILYNLMECIGWNYWQS
jgi:hypothetical protein